jgi:hypothetical protein
VRGKNHENKIDTGKFFQKKREKQQQKLPPLPLPIHGKYMQFLSP